VRDPRGDVMTYEILNNFPFKSERKRMGIIVRVIGRKEGDSLAISGADL
jgi:magnesium-transporting ATPase (P-type)